MTLYLRNKPIKQHTKGNVQWEECVFGLKGAGQKSGAQCSLLQQKQPCLGSRDRLWEWSKAKGSRAFLASSVHQPSPRALGIVTIQRNKPSRQESGSITHTSPFPTEPLLLLGPMTLAQTFNSLSPVLASLVWCSSQSSAHLSVWNSGSFCLHPLLDPLHWEENLMLLVLAAGNLTPPTPGFPQWLSGQASSLERAVQAASNELRQSLWRNDVCENNVWEYPVNIYYYCCPKFWSLVSVRVE